MGHGVLPSIVADVSEESMLMDWELLKAVVVNVLDDDDIVG